MGKRRRVIVAIVLIAALLRFYKLGQNPPSIDWDEASIGYNAYSLLKTGKDEYGNSWPVSIRSFNDYKPPLYTYLTIPSVAIFGLNEFSVRFPSATAGTLTVLLTYFLVKELFREKSLNLKHLPRRLAGQTLNIGEIAAALLAISPWHLQFSRVAFEANLALALFVLAVFLMLKAFRSGTLFHFIGAALVFVLTVYSYHSARVVVPLFLILVSIIFRKQLTEHKAKAMLAAALIAAGLIPIGITLTRGAAQARFSTVSVFTNPGLYTREEERLTRQEDYQKQDENFTGLFHNRWLILTQIIVENYFDHFNLKFFFLAGDGIGRHGPVGMGLLYFWELPFLAAGMYYLVKNKEPASRIIFPWLLVAPSASALTTQTPHAVRSLLLLPTLQIITAYGIIQTSKLFKRNWYLLAVGSLVIINFFYYLNLYWIHTPVERSHDWQYGYKQLVSKVNLIKDEASEVIITTEYDQPYIYFLFYEKPDPVWYQKVAEGGSAGFGKYFFRKIEYERDKLVDNAIIIAAPHEIPEDAPIFDTIQFLNGEDAFLLVRT